MKYAWGQGWDNLPQRQAAGDGALQGGARLEPHSTAWNGQNIGWMNNAGDGVTFTNLNASSMLDIDYAAASTGTFSLYINGARNQTLTFPGTGDWNTFTTKTVYTTIPAGASVTLQHDTGDAPINIDYVQQRGAMTVRQGASVGRLLNGAKVEAHSNAWNGQNVGWMNNVGDGVRYSNLNASSRISIDYAAASTGTFSLYINGARNQTLTFPGTGDWNTFTTKTVYTTIPAGASVTLQHDSGDAPINIDYIEQPWQAEYGTLLGGAKDEIRGAASDGIDVGYLLNTGDGVSFSGVFAANHLAIDYAAAQAGTLSLYINGVRSQTVSFPATADWGSFTETTVNVGIPRGATVALKRDATDSSPINVAYVSD